MAPPSAPLHDAQLERLVLLRWISLAVMLLSCWPLPALLGLRLPTAALLSIILALAAANFFTLAWLKNPAWTNASGPGAAFAQLLLDLAGWTLFLHFAGGATNPLISMLLPLVAIGATVLPSLHAGLLASLAIGAYSLLWAWNVPIELDNPDLATPLHLAGMWLTFALSAIVITSFVIRMTGAIRERDRALAAAGEEMARAAHIVALGNQAAGTAHSLGTPLGTMRIVVDDLLAGDHRDAALREDLQLVSAQIEQCRQILSRITAEAGARRAEGGRQRIAAEWIGETIDRWRAQRPHARITFHCEPALSQTLLVVDETLSQALHTLVNNAADASADAVTLHATRDTGELRIDIADRGAGLPPALRDAPGNAPWTERPAGMGIGLYLARHTLQRYGGRLEFHARDGGGTIARLNIPLESLPA